MQEYHFKLISDEFLFPGRNNPWLMPRELFFQAKTLHGITANTKLGLSCFSPQVKSYLIGTGNNYKGIMYQAYAYRADGRSHMAGAEQR
jgi:hypothetical protein